MNTKKIVRKFTKMRKITPPYSTSAMKEKKCWEIVHYLKLEKKYISISKISKHFSLTEKDIMSYINYIRERNHSFFNPTNKKFIVDNGEEVKLSLDKIEKKEFIKILKNRKNLNGADKTSLKSQLLEIKITCYN